MQKSGNTLSIIYAAFVFSSLIYLVVGFALMKSGWKPVLSADGNLPLILLILFCTSSVVMIGIALKIKSVSGVENALSGAVIQFALCEVPAILGLTLFFLTAKFLYLLLLCVLSFCAFVMVKPRTQ